METLIIKPNIDKNGKNKKIVIGIVIFLGVLIGMLSFDMLQPSRIQFIDKTRESNEFECGFIFPVSNILFNNSKIREIRQEQLLELGNVNCFLISILVALWALF